MSKPLCVNVDDPNQHIGVALDKAGLTAIEFGVMRCASCGRPVSECGDTMILTPICHPGAPFLVEYTEGSLIVKCFACNRHVATIAVKEAPEVGNVQ